MTYFLKVQNIFIKLRDILQSEVSDADWLDRKSKRAALIKVQNMRAWVGYPIWYDCPGLKQRYPELYLNPADVNALWVQQHNLLYISTGILQPPIINTEVSYVVNYASTGFVIAHELYHAFDNYGINYNSVGQMDPSQWSTKVKNEYDTKAKCFIKQYMQFPLKELKSSNLPMRDGVNTFMENMPDAMGAKLAYELYKQKLHEKDGTCYTLPNFENFSCDQLFFIALANAHCGEVTSNVLNRYIRKSKHAIPRYRVNGPLANMEEFATAFKCRNKSVMKLPSESQCDLWA